MDEEANKDEGTLSWWERKEKRSEIKKKLKKKKECKCMNCIWGDAISKFCMFPKCFIDFDKRREKK